VASDRSFPPDFVSARLLMDRRRPGRDGRFDLPPTNPSVTLNWSFGKPLAPSCCGGPQTAWGRSALHSPGAPGRSPLTTRPDQSKLASGTEPGGGSQLHRVLRAYADYYNGTRTPLSLGKDAPLPRAVRRNGRIRSVPHLGGLHYSLVRI